MIRVNVLYPRTGGASFDWDHGPGTHVPVVTRRIGAAARTTGIAPGFPPA